MYIYANGAVQERSSVGVEECHTDKEILIASLSARITSIFQMYFYHHSCESNLLLRYFTSR